MKKIHILLLVLFCLSCRNEKKHEAAVDTVSVPPVSSDATNISAQDSVKAIGREVLTCLKNRDYEELQKYFSEKGVLFVPYSYIDSQKQQRFTADDFIKALKKKQVLLWGEYDGTGDPIKLTVAAYLNKFVYNADYLDAEAVAVDTRIKQGNSIDNIAEVFPQAHFMDYHFSGFNQQYGGLDWSSLRLVFEKEQGDYYLVAIIHDQWTV